MYALTGVASYGTLEHVAPRLPKAFFHTAQFGAAQSLQQPILCSSLSRIGILKSFLENTKIVSGQRSAPTPLGELTTFPRIPWSTGKWDIPSSFPLAFQRLRRRGHGRS